MPKPRKECVSLDATPYYHCVSRCVRRAFLCGTDTNTGKSFEHRRDWIEQRIIELTQAFAIDVCAYAVMSNHYHIVVKIDVKETSSWSIKETLERWTQLFAAKPLVQIYLSKPSQLLPTQLTLIEELTIEYKRRLGDLSWFMRCLNEPIARQANAEDNCTGHFWESRFKSQALLDEAALLSAMAYVDLNPIRANMASTPETSDFTSIQARLQQPQIDKHLLPFATTHSIKQQIETIPFNVEDYLTLVDWTGRAIRNDKRGHINNNLPPILTRLNIDPQQWIKQQPNIETHYPNFLGKLENLQHACQKFRRKWIKGRQHAKLLFG